MSILRKDTDTTFWISYSDLVAGLLFIFLAILLISHFSFAYQEEKNERVFEKLKYFLELREKIAENLKLNFENKGIDVEIDPKTGILTIKEMLLFDVDRSVLKPEGKELLKQIIPVYTQTLLGSKEFKEWIKSIVIEGHASKEREERYLLDMRLSQKRAFSVLSFIFGNEFCEFNFEEELKKMSSAQGRGFMVPLEREPEESRREWRRRNRRVEIKYQLQNDRMLKALSDIMSNKIT